MEPAKPRSLREQLAASLLRLRGTAELSLAQLARKTGFSRPTLNQLERGMAGGILDTADRYIEGCRGEIVIVAAAQDEIQRAELAELVATMPMLDIDVLLRLARARPHLSDVEWHLLADATDLRIEAIRAAEDAAAELPPVVRLRR